MAKIIQLLPHSNNTVVTTHHRNLVLIRSIFDCYFPMEYVNAKFQQNALPPFLSIPKHLGVTAMPTLPFITIRRMSTTVPQRETGALGGAGKAEKPQEEEAEHFSLYSDIFFTPSLIVSCPLPHQPAAWSPPMRTARSRVPLCHFVISSSSSIAQPLFCIQFGFYLKHSQNGVQPAPQVHSSAWGEADRSEFQVSLSPCLGSLHKYRRVLVAIPQCCGTGDR